MSKNIVYSTGYAANQYEVFTIDNPQDNISILCEDGAYHNTMSGYGVRNVETGVVEVTTQSLPVAIYQCKSSHETLDHILQQDEELKGPENKLAEVVDLRAVNVPDDILPN